MKAKDRGFLQGYRDEIKGSDLEWEQVSRRWRKGYREGRAAARDDLEHRAIWRLAPRPDDQAHLRRIFGLQGGGA